MTPKKDKYLSILLAVLICLIVAASIVIARMPRGQTVKYYDTTPKYDENIVRLGVSASKFGGMAIYMDLPLGAPGRSFALGHRRSRLHPRAEGAGTRRNPVCAAG